MFDFTDKPLATIECLQTGLAGNKTTIFDPSSFKKIECGIPKELSVLEGLASNPESLSIKNIGEAIETFSTFKEQLNRTVRYCNVLIMTVFKVEGGRNGLFHTKNCFKIFYAKNMQLLKALTKTTVKKIYMGLKTLLIILL